MTTPVTIACLTFNWPQRYKIGGKVADERLWRDFEAVADVIGLSESMHTFTKVLRDEKDDWQFHGHHDAQDTTLCVKRSVFEVVSKGHALLSPPMPVTPGTKGRNPHPQKEMAWAECRHRESDTLWTFGVVHFVPSKHLGGRTLEVWKKQRDSVIEFLKAREGQRVVIMGDFNAQIGDPASQPLWEHARVQTAPSHGQRAIDWIVRSRNLLSDGSGKALPNRRQSDHRPVLGKVVG